MRKIPSWLQAVTVFVGVFAAVFALSGGQDAAPPSSFQSGAIGEVHDGTAPSRNADKDAAPVWSHGEDGATRNGEEHWRKHGRDFSEFHSAEEYERGAKDFVDHPPPGTRVKHRANGDTLYYDPGTGDFAVENRQGKPRTFFRPRNGEAYWDRQ